MLNRIREKLDRRLLSLPLHHIDTSILLEPVNADDGRYCRRYLQRLGYNYRGKVSFPALSELMIVILELETFNKRYDLLETIVNLIKVRKIGFYSPLDVGKLLDKIKEVDRRIFPLDREIVACAIEDKAFALVTLDKNLIKNQKLEQEFKIEILHPKNLL